MSTPITITPSIDAWEHVVFQLQNLTVEVTMRDGEKFPANLVRLGDQGRLEVERFHLDLVENEVAGHAYIDLDEVADLYVY